MTSTPAKAHELLAWDSGLFGFPVARLRPEALGPAAIAGALQGLAADGVRLAYAIFPWGDAAAEAAMAACGARRVDRKVTYRTALPPESPWPPEVVRWTAPEPSPALEALALASGHLSRFKVDPQIPPRVFTELYLTWIRRSVRGELADAVLVTWDGERLTGMVTIGRKGDAGVIGLIAVADGLRGRGLGRKLMQAAEAWCRQQGLAALEVVTQGDNQAACALYEAQGGVRVGDVAVHHLWREASP